MVAIAIDCGKDCDILQCLFRAQLVFLDARVRHGGSGNNSNNRLGTGCHKQYLTYCSWRCMVLRTAKEVFKHMMLCPRKGASYNCFSPKLEVCKELPTVYFMQQHITKQKNESAFSTIGPPPTKGSKNLCLTPVGACSPRWECSSLQIARKQNIAQQPQKPYIDYRDYHELVRFGVARLG